MRSEPPKEELERPEPAATPAAKRRQESDADELRRHFEAYSSFVMANLLWAMVGLAVVTLPVATVALMTVMSERVRGRQPDVIWTFLTAAREKWRTATLIGLIDAAAVGFVAINISIVGRMQSDDFMFVVSGAVTLFFGTVVLSVNVYMWALLALEDLPVRRVIDMSLRFALAYPLPTFGVLGASAALIAGSLLLPRGVFVFVTASAVAYVTAWGSWRVIRRHLTDEELRRFAGQPDA